MLEEASDYVRAAAWSQNLLATAGYDRTVRIYDSDQDREREVRLWVRCPCGIPKKKSSKTPGVEGSWIVSLSSIFKLSLGLIQRCGVFVAVVSNILQRVLASAWKCVPFLCLWSSSCRLVWFLWFFVTVAL